MKNLLLRKLALLNDQKMRVIIMTLIIASLILISNYAYATDYLTNTMTDLKDTMKNSGKHWLIWLDGGVSLATFIYTKKPIVFFSVIGILVFMNLLVALTGG